MKRRHDLGSLLRWYPSSWRSRYGEEFLSLLEDRLDGASPTWRFRSSVAVAGMRERCYDSGVIGARTSLSTQRRTGALMVLIAWAAMVVAGAGLAKTAEHFAAALPRKSSFVADVAYHTTVLAGVVGTVLVVAGGLVAMPGFFRLLRLRRGSELRGHFGRAVVASAVLTGLMLGLSLWAHHLDVTQRNGGDRLYSGAFILWALCAAVTLGLWTRAVVSAATRIDFAPRALRWESWCALGVSVLSVVVIGGAGVWWVQMGLHASWFLQGTTAGVPASPWSAQLVVIALVMALAGALALWGASRVVLTIRPARQDV